MLRKPSPLISSGGRSKEYTQTCAEAPATAMAPVHFGCRDGAVYDTQTNTQNCVVYHPRLLLMCTSSSVGGVAARCRSRWLKGWACGMLLENR